MGKTYREVLSRASSFRNKGTGRVCDPIPFLARKNWQKLDWLLHMDQQISPADKVQIEADLQQLLAHRPPIPFRL